LYIFLISPVCTTCPAHLILLEFIILISDEMYELRSFSLLAPCYLFSLKSKYSSQNFIIKHLKSVFFPRVGYQVRNP
jgi:hypothetical protein